MTTFDKVNRRTHLYLGLFLMPWLLMYGVSSLIVIHQSWFKLGESLPREPVFEKAYNRPVNAQGVNNSPELRAVAAEILKDCHMEGAFWVDKPNADMLHIERFSFWGSTSLIYSIKEQ